MKIKKMPLLLTKKDGFKFALSGAIQVSSIMAKMEKALSRQLELVDKLKGAPLSANSQKIENLLKKINLQAQSLELNGQKIATGKYSWESPVASMWYRSDIYMDSRIRLFIPNISLGSYFNGMNDPGLIADSLRSKSEDARNRELRRIIQEVKKKHAQVCAYESRIDFVKKYQENSLKRNEKLSDLFQDVNKGQMSLLEYTFRQLELIESIVIRIQRLTLEAKNRKKSERIFSAMEVSELVDEVDRIASQSSFNKINLFHGYYSRDSRSASLWFVDSSMSKRKRIYISAITAMSLGLRENNGRIILLSDHKNIDRSLEEAANARFKINREKKSVKEYISYFLRYPFLSKSAKALFPINGPK